MNDNVALQVKLQYVELLTLDDGTLIPDANDIPSDQWMAEAAGLEHWPPCMIVDISDYLVSRNERPLCSRLRNDYKEGMCHLNSRLIYVILCELYATEVAVWYFCAGTMGH